MKKSLKDHRDVVSGSVLFVAALLYFVGTRSLPAGQGEPGPAFFPILLSLVLGALGLSILLRGVKKSSEGNPESERSLCKPWLTVLLTGLYVAFFQGLGFVLSTWLYTLSVTVMFRRDRWLLLVVVPIVSTTLIYLLFRMGLGVRLPAGPIELP